MEMQRNDYYVYVHRRINDGVVFYVGKGRKNRAFQGASNKTILWSKVNNESGGHTVELIETSLTNEDAISLENYLLTYPPHNWELVNKVKSQVELDYDTFDFSKYVYYDETSYTGLRWKIDNNAYGKNKRFAGDVAGSRYDSKHDTRSLVSINGKLYYAHRIVWKIFNKDIPMKGLVINHIDNNPSNNNINNLELVTQEVNCQKSKTANGKVRSNNNTGINGVMESSFTRKDGTIIKFAVVQWKDDTGKIKSKSFSYNKYINKENAFNAAMEFRLTKVAKLVYE